MAEEQLRIEERLEELEENPPRYKAFLVPYYNIITLFLKCRSVMLTCQPDIGRIKMGFSSCRVGGNGIIMQWGISD